MSVKAIAWAFQQEMFTSDKFVLVAIAECANDTWLAWPSVTLLSRKVCLDHRTVQRAVARLIETSHIIDTGQRLGRTNQVRVFKLNLTKQNLPKLPLWSGKGDIMPPLKGGIMPPFEAGKGDTCADERVTPVQER